jgi:hypothetical protein
LEISLARGFSPNNVNSVSSSALSAASAGSFFGIVADSLPNVISNLIYIGINIRGWIKWKKEPPRECLSP